MAKDLSREVLRQRVAQLLESHPAIMQRTLFNVRSFLMISVVDVPVSVSAQNVNFDGDGIAGNDLIARVAPP